MVYTTVALDNEQLVAALVHRRELLQTASFHVRFRDDGTPMQQIPLGLQESRKLLAKKLRSTEEECRSLLKLTYDATSVFVTFDAEEAQRNALQALSASKIAIAMNDTTDVSSEHLFRGSRVLHVEEAREPSVIRWQDLNETFGVRMAQRMFTAVVTLCLILAGFVAVKRAFHINLQSAAFLIAILNIAVPNLIKIVNRLESHTAEASYEASLFAKIALFRFVNTALVTTLIKPFTATISSDKAALIPAVYAVLKLRLSRLPWFTY